MSNGIRYNPTFFFIVKTAILGPEAKDGEVTILEVETTGYNDKKVQKRTKR